MCTKMCRCVNKDINCSIFYSGRKEYRLHSDIVIQWNTVAIKNDNVEFHLSTWFMI